VQPIQGNAKIFENIDDPKHIGIIIKKASDMKVIK
jgi:hypothetical protein